MSLLEIRGLTVDFRQDGRAMPAVRNASFHVGAGETVAVVGESGSGKSVTALATVDLSARKCRGARLSALSRRRDDWRARGPAPTHSRQ